MQTARMTTAHTIATVECGAIFVSLELSRSTWLVTTLAAPVGSKLSRHQVRGGDMPGLLERFSDLQRHVHRRTGRIVPVIDPGSRTGRVLDSPRPGRGRDREPRR